MNLKDKNLENKGFKYIKFNNETKKFIKEVNDIVTEYFKKNIKKNKNYTAHIFKIQNLINKKFPPRDFFNLNKKIFKKIFNHNEYAIQHYFYFRAIKPFKESKNTYKPVNFHRESYQGPKFYKNIFNLWIPLKNCSTATSLNYFPHSHKFKLNKDFKYEEKLTDVQKNSYSHKLGSLYKEKVFTFKKKIKTKKLFQKNSIILFLGELIHGNAVNKSKKIRMSLDLRFMLKKHMKFNPVQSATNKKYFEIIKFNNNK